MRLTQQQHELLMEALRRTLKFHPNEPLQDAWTGLGYKTTYAPVLDTGLMKWVGKEPHPRTAGWLKLTELGAEIVQSWIDAGYVELTLMNDWEIPVNHENQRPPQEVEIS